MRKVSSGGGKASQVEGGLRFDAEAWVVSEAPTHFEASSTVTNVSDKLVTLEYGACAFSVRAYPESGWTGWQKPEAWDPRRQPEPLLMIPAPYILILRITTLDPGGSLSFRATYHTYEIVGHSSFGVLRPEGRYVLNTHLDMKPVSGNLDVGVAELYMEDTPLS